MEKLPSTLQAKSIGPDELGGEEGEYVLVMDDAVAACERAMACRTFGEWAAATGQVWEEMFEEHGDEYARAAGAGRLTPETQFSYADLAAEVELATFLLDPRLAALEWIEQNIAPEVLRHPSLNRIEWREGISHRELAGPRDAFVAMQDVLREAGYLGIRMRQLDGGEFAFLTL